MGDRQSSTWHVKSCFDLTLGARGFQLPNYPTQLTGLPQVVVGN